MASLARGATGLREYNGIQYHIKVLKGRYKVVETREEHWTLYDVMKMHTGLHQRGGRKLTNWSVPKFYRKALEMALHGPQKTLPRKHPSQAEAKRKSRAAKRKAKSKLKAPPRRK